MSGKASTKSPIPRESATADEATSNAERVQQSDPEVCKEKQHEPQPSNGDLADYCILAEREKIGLMLLASFAALISPISGSIYLPAVNSLSRDLHVSISDINLTISTYLIFQGIAPSFTAAFSEAYGRRPAYMLCFIIYLGANLGLALQNNYAALLVLRCMQSSGSSGTVALGSGVVADLSTRAERGKYIGYVSMGVTLGPALGPVIGGLLEHFLGWRSIFWFLVIFCGTSTLVMASVFPETCRSIVGNSSIKPARWNRSLLQIINEDFRRKPLRLEDFSTLQKSKRHPNPLNSLKILSNRETCIIALYSASLFAGYSSVLSVLTSQLEERFNFNAIQIGLCYLPLGVGSLTSRRTVGFLLDKNFRREAQIQGLEIVKNRQQSISNFNIEKARITITFPYVLGACIFITAYGWTMHFHTPLAAPLVMLFFVGHLTTGAFTSLNTLVTDINREQPATASAASNLCRCLLAAGAVAAATPIIDAIGIGWAAMICAFVWIASSPLIWIVYARGYRWRRENARGDGEGDS